MRYLRGPGRVGVLRLLWGPRLWPPVNSLLPQLPHEDTSACKAHRSQNREAENAGWLEQAEDRQTYPQVSIFTYCLMETS